MNCPICKVNMKLLMDHDLNEKYYHCDKCKSDILHSIAKIKISKDTQRIIKYS